MKRLTGLWAILMLTVGAGFGLSLSGAINTTFLDFPMNETVTLEVGQDTSYYLLYNNVLPTSYFDVSESTIYTLIEFPVSPVIGEHAIFVNVRETDSNDRYYMQGYGPTSTVSINERDALGKYSLVEGTYQITITPATLDTQDIEDAFEFTIVPTTFIRDLLLSIFLGIGTILFLVLFFISYSQRKQALDQMMEFDGYTYKQRDVNELFDMDEEDWYDEYSKRR